MKLSTLCYIEKEGQYLLLHRVKKENDVNRDKWIGVGGKFLEGESPEECLLREVKEETGLSLTRWRFRGIVTFVCPPWPVEYMHLYTADGFEGEVGECDEGVLEWVDKQKVCDLPIWEGDRLFLARLSQDAPPFSLKLVYEGDRLVEYTFFGE
ncbi:MAG: 8-oxo-dGTP diphosphatase [Ruminococcaceae bacterium]|nr:8-oxo-dGTP diphosphatase [Oscillospiraceae bacterium]MBQ2780916.1 8-oxo-dGTP diphosphatase [Clostridia bacterium]